MEKDTIVKLAGIFTLFGFSALGMLLIYAFQDIPVRDVLFGGESWPWQLLIGTTYGILAGLLMVFVSRMEFIEPAISQFSNKIFENFNPNFEDIIFYSFCAGVGEEVFFRAGIQPFIGVWLTAFIFVFLHGYLNPQNWRLSVIGILAVIITAGMGYLFIHLGLVSAICSHFIFDVVTFSYLVYYKKA